MKYKCLSIDGKTYGDDDVKREEFKIPSVFPDVTNVAFWDYRLIDEINQDYK